VKKRWLLPLLRRRFLVALLVAAQAILFLYFLSSTSRISSLLANSFSAISILVALFVLAGKGESSYKLTWIFVILCFPVVGGLLYLFFDQHILRHSLIRRARRAEMKTRAFMDAAGGVSVDTPSFPRTVRYLSGFAGFPAYFDSKSVFLASGEEMFARLKTELVKAKRYIFLEYFIIEHGTMWDEILDILLEKVEEGVEVRIIYDDMGCFLRLPNKYGKVLKKYGIRAAKFNPFVPFFSVEQNNRDHRKITVIDGKVAFTGGINLADEYIGEIERFGKWADNAVMVEGAAAWSFTLMFLQMWSLIHRGEEEDLLRFLPEPHRTDRSLKLRQVLRADPSSADPFRETREYPNRSRCRRSRFPPSLLRYNRPGRMPSQGICATSSASRSRSRSSAVSGKHPPRSGQKTQVLPQERAKRR
jgi:cardiolipin synthase